MRTVVEIGPADDPRVMAIAAGTQDTDLRYFAIESGRNVEQTYLVGSAAAKHILDGTAEALAGSELPEGTTYFPVIADAESLPFGEGVVDEAVLSNVAGHYLFDRSHLRFPKVLSEMLRILRPGGDVTIYESLTPFPIRLLRKQVQSVGFVNLTTNRSPAVVHVPRSKALRSLDARYGSRPSDAWYDPRIHDPTHKLFFGWRYFLQARKPV